MSAVRVWKKIPEVSLYRSPLQFHVKQVTSWVLKRERSNIGKNTLLIPAHLILVRVKIMETIDLHLTVTRGKNLPFALLQKFVRV